MHGAEFGSILIQFEKNHSFKPMLHAKKYHE